MSRSNMYFKDSVSDFNAIHWYMCVLVGLSVLVYYVSFIPKMWQDL